MSLVRCVCSYGVAVSMWSSSRPCLASALACLLLLMFVWVLILWSVTIYVQALKQTFNHSF